ncbi:MAG: heme ABC exporter ATP-binding protein CcmA [Pseudomonadota bacterium]
MALELSELAAMRGGRVVFSGLKARLQAGSATALRGPNGIGKSTLLRVLAGLLPPSAGEAYHDGVSLSQAPAAFQERVLYAGHRDGVKPALRVAENLRIWARLHAAPEARIETALARFGLERLAERPAAECSAGQMRRLGLARLLVIERPLWLLDEPTVSLDTTSVALVAELVKAHITTGGIALIATHADLGLSACATLEMTPPVPGQQPVAPDPFLDGAWQ